MTAAAYSAYSYRGHASPARAGHEAPCAHSDHPACPQDGERLTMPARRDRAAET